MTSQRPHGEILSKELSFVEYAEIAALASLEGTRLHGTGLIDGACVNGCGILNRSQSVIKVSDGFKRTDAENEAITKKRVEARRNRKEVEMKHFRSKSLERARTRRKEREQLEVIEVAIEFEDEHSSRSHQKRGQRQQLRAEHRELLKWKERHQAYLKNQQKERRLINYATMTLEMMSSEVEMDGIPFTDSDSEDEKKEPEIREPSPVRLSFLDLAKTQVVPKRRWLKRGEVPPVDVLPSEFEKPPAIRVGVAREKWNSSALDPNPSTLGIVHKGPSLPFFVPSKEITFVNYRGDNCKYKLPGGFVKDPNVIMKRWKNLRDKSDPWLASKLDGAKEYGKSLMDTPAFKALKDCFVGENEKSRIFGIIVSTVSFLRLAVVIPSNWCDITMLCWLHLKACGFHNDVSAIGSFAVSSFSMLVIKLVKYFVEYHKTRGMKVESYGDSIDGFLTGTHNFLSHPLIAAIRNIIIFLAALHIFDKPVAGSIFKHLGKPEGYSFVSLLMTALKDISTMIRQGEAWLFGKPGTVDLLGDNPLTTALAVLTNKIDMAEYVYTGLPIEGYVERNQYITELRNAVESLRSVIDLSVKSEVRRLKADITLRNGQKLLNDFTGAANASFRATPLGIVIPGPPGIGKSHVLKFIAYIHSLVKGREFNEEAIYTRTGEFWEGYSPFSHPYIHYSESGKMKKSQALAKGDETMDELLSVIDNLSYPVNMAFKDKGKIFALPEMVLIDTNNVSLNFDELYENPAAFRRRFLYIEPIVRAEYSITKEVGGAFNTSDAKAAEAGTDAWLFNVYRMVPLNNKQSKQVEILKAGSANALIDTLVPIFAKHIQYEEEMLKRIANGSMFSVHEDFIISKAALFGCYPKKEAKVLDDGKIEVHPDSLFSQAISGASKLRDQISNIFGEKREKVLEEMESEEEVSVVASITNHKDNLLAVRSTEDLDEPDIKEDLPASQGEHSIEAYFDWPKAAFVEGAPKHFTLKDVADFFITQFTDEEITAYCKTLGLAQVHKIVVDRTTKKICLYTKKIFSQEYVYDDEVVFTPTKIQLRRSPFYNIIMGAFNGWELFWDAYMWCCENSEESATSENMKVEFYDPESLIMTLLSAGWFIWIVCFFFIARVMVNQNLTMNLNLSQDRVFFLIFSVVCIITRQYGPWIFFLSIFLSCLHIQDNLRKQAIGMVDKCISDGLDGIGFAGARIKSEVTQVPDKTPRRNFWKLKAVAAFCGIAIAALATIKCVSELVDSDEKKKSVVISPPVAPTSAPSVNVHVVSGSFNDKGLNPDASIHKGNATGGTAPLFKTITQSVADEKAITPETTFSKMTVHDSELLELEKTYHCGKSIERIPNKLDPEKWNVRIAPPPVYTGDADDFVKHIGFNCRICTAVDPVTNVKRTGHILGLWANYGVMHLHGFEGSPEGKLLMISPTGYAETESVKIPTMIDETNYRKLSSDLILVRCNQIRFQDIRKFLPDLKDMPMIAFARIGRDPVTAIRKMERTTLYDKGRPIVFTDFFTYQWYGHNPGKCGVPLVGQVGKGWVLLGIHSAGSDQDHYCMTSTIIKSELSAAALSMEENSLLCPLASSKLEFTTEAPNSKSVTRFVEMHGANYFGKLPGPVIMPSASKVAPTGLNEDGLVDKIFYEILDHKCETQFGPPPMRGFFRDGQYYDPDVRFASKVAQQKQPMNRKTLDRCIKEFVDRIESSLHKKKRFQLQPWDLDTAINGAVDDVYARAMDLNKAAGFGRTGKKKAYFDVVEKATGKWAEMIESLRGEVLEALKLYGLGESKGVFFEACLKDEPRDVKKCQIGKTRTFCVSPLVNLIITRMFFGPIFSTMVEQGDIFCAAIGTDMHRYAQDLYNRLATHSNNIMELDYGNYDQTMPYELGWAAGSVVYQVCKRFGYSKEALQVVSGLVSDNLHPFVILKKDVFELPGYQPSGKYGTAEDNSLRGVLMLMYVWYEGFSAWTEKLSFFDHVVPWVYGDDVLCAVDDECKSFFNNIRYSKHCERLVGLECTPASKGADFTPFVELSTMMFLKRRFKKHAAYDVIVAPLDLDSLMKTLSWHIPSGSISPVEQVIAALDSVIRELFFHCDEAQFNEISKQLYDLAESKFNIRGHIKRLSFAYIAASTVCSTSRSVVEGRQNISYEDSILGEETSCDVEMKEMAQEVGPVVKVKSASFTGSEVHGSGLCGFQWTTDNTLLLRIELSSRLEKCQNEYDSKPTQKLKEEIIALIETINMIDRNRSIAMDSSHIFLESSEMLDISADNFTETRHENLRDVSGDVVDEETKEPSFLAYSLSQTDVDLRKYLSRPQQIASGTMALDTPFAINLDVYNLLLATPDIRAKLRTFGFLRAALRIRLTISATAFHQGRILMGWIPWYNRCPSAQQAMNYVGDTFLPLQYMSTLKHQKTIDIKSNKPAELYVPYMHLQPMCRLFNNSNVALGSASSFDDFVDIGRLFIRSINVPEAVSATPTSPYYQVYAWFEEVTYTMVTGTKMTLALESDERIVGPIEKAASAATKVFDYASKFPGIASFASSSRMISSGIGEIAAHMGWSRPSLLQDPTRMRDEPYTCAANVLGGDLSHRLTLDPKQEVSIDPSPLAVKSDELTIAGMCATEQLLDTADWLTSSATLTPFWTMGVTPRAMRKSAIDNTSIPSPMALASSYFGYWHGDITLRFDVVKTTFHKGKFAIIWDPNFPQRTLITTALKLHSEYVYIVDIQELDNLEITIKWAFPQAWAAVPSADNGVKSVGTIGAVSPNFGLRSCNGFVSLIPITKLQSPLDKSVHINVYIRSENMHFNLFTDKAISRPWIPTVDIESDMKVESQDVGNLAPVKIVINTGANEYNGISKYHFGEEPLSFRSMLKRYRTSYNVVESGDPVFVLTSSIIPPFDPPESKTDFTTNDKLLGILRRCFVGMKGSYKYRIRSVSTDDVALAMNSATVSLENPSSTSAFYTASQSVNRTDMGLGIIGGTSYIPFQQSGIEFEAPFYSSALFHFAQLDNPLPSASYTDPNQVRNWKFFMCPPTSKLLHLAIDVAAGEDFMLMHFLSAPMMTI